VGSTSPAPIAAFTDIANGSRQIFENLAAAQAGTFFFHDSVSILAAHNQGSLFFSMMAESRNSNVGDRNSVKSNSGNISSCIPHVADIISFRL
jgi:hypothetical protein